MLKKYFFQHSKLEVSNEQLEIDEKLCIVIANGSEAI